jgi:PilZ domain
MSEDKRRGPRHRCRVAAQIRFCGKNYDGHIIDLSENGVRLLADELTDIWTGDRVEVFSADLGWMSGRVKWRRPGAFGLSLDESSNTRAKFQAFRKNFILA